MPVVARMALRSVTRSRRRTVATIIGGVLALVLILASAGMLTSVRAMLDIEFGWSNAKMPPFWSRLEPMMLTHNCNRFPASESSSRQPLHGLPSLRTDARIRFHSPASNPPRSCTDSAPPTAPPGRCQPTAC